MSNKQEILENLEEAIDTLNNYYDAMPDMINNVTDKLKSVQWSININMEDK